MQNRATKLFVKYDDWRQGRALDRDGDGLSLVAYALGAAFIVVPMAIALFLFGQQASGRASTDLGTLLNASTPTLP